MPAQPARMALIRVTTALLGARHPNHPPADFSFESIAGIEAAALAYLKGLEHVAPETRAILDNGRQEMLRNAHHSWSAVSRAWRDLEFPGATPLPPEAPEAPEAPAGWEKTNPDGVWTKGGVTVDARMQTILVSAPAADGFTTQRSWPDASHLPAAFEAAEGLLVQPTPSYPPATPTRSGKYGPKLAWPAPGERPIPDGELVKSRDAAGNIVREPAESGPRTHCWTSAGPYRPIWFRRAATLSPEEYFTDINGDRLELYNG